MIGTKGLKKIAKFILSPLCVLNISSNNIENPLTILNPYLANNNTLLDLNLSHNLITDPLTNIFETTSVLRLSLRNT
jgi:hypothetical protein